MSPPLQLGQASHLNERDASLREPLAQGPHVDARQLGGLRDAQQGLHLGDVAPLAAVLLRPSCRLPYRAASLSAGLRLKSSARMRATSALKALTLLNGPLGTGQRMAKLRRAVAQPRPERGEDEGFSLLRYTTTLQLLVKPPTFGRLVGLLWGQGLNPFVIPLPRHILEVHRLFRVRHVMLSHVSNPPAVRGVPLVLGSQGV